MKHKDFSYWLKVSLAGHIVVFVFFALDFSFSKKEILPSLRVDIVDLPDKVKKALKKETQNLKQKRPQKKKKKEQKALSLKKNPVKKREKEKDNKDVKEQRTVFKGNILAEGQGLEGLNRLSMERYYEEVGEAVREHFVTPQWLDSEGLKAQIEVSLDDRGRIVTQSFVKRSGNELFDNQALEAVKKAQPLPKPPDRIKKLFYKINFVLKFPD